MLFQFKIGYLFLFFLLTTASSSPPSSIQPNTNTPPNFIFILTDDQGWNGTSVEIKAGESASKSDFYETPNLELLAQQGMTFSQAYAPAPKCSPTRNSILTGQTTARNQFTNTGNDNPINQLLFAPLSVTNIDNNDVTIGEWLKATSLNYRTAHYGKWHIGNGGTTANGFDFGDGNTNNNDGDAGDGQSTQSDPKKIFDLTNRSMAFMDQAAQDGVPFYLQISHYAVHTAIEAQSASINYYTTKTPGNVHDNINYAAMTQDLDTGIGQIMQKIQDLGIENNTYLIFMSDNGAQNNQSSNGVLDNGKNFLSEGGIRIPMIVKGPNIPTNTYCNEAVAGYDLFPTIAMLSQGTNILPVDLDGQDLTPLFTQNNFDRQVPLYFHSPNYGNGTKVPRSAVILQNHKLIVNYENCTKALFDLDADLNEGNAQDIYSSNIVLGDSLFLLLRDHLKEVNANMPSLNPTFFTGSGADVDADGLDDAWEFREFLCYNYTGTDDPDGDGRDNEQEESEQTDPLVATTALQVKVFLQGTFNPTNIDMRTELMNQLPLTDPYLGTTATSIPPEVVDWVLLQIRHPMDSTQVIAEQACFLRKDGQVLNQEGDDQLYFNDLGVNEAYLAIQHRNHLGVLTGETIPFSSSSICLNDNSTSTTNIGCTFDPDGTNMYTESVATQVRTISSNTFPNHRYGLRNGASISPVSKNFSMNETPTVAASVTSILDVNNRPTRYFGVGLNGVILAPAPALPFIFENPNTGEYNWDWVFEPTNNQGNGADLVALDCSSAHVSSQGYHYHGNMFEYAENILPGISTNVVPSAPVQIAWASDGFPIFYRYAPDENGILQLLQPSYQLKNGERLGDGITEPCGLYNGKYTSDYEYVVGSGDLDECNGIARSVTISTVAGDRTFEYFYVITDDFPQVGRCLVGTPDPSFNN